MIHAYDQWLLLPVRDLYDTQTMAMAINAAKDMYDKGLEQIKDFYKTYGDFISPIQKDMDWYSENVTGRVRDTINDLYANGIDPLRSAEGRAAVSQLIYSMPVGDIAKLRQSADAAKEYIKNRGALEAAGKYNADLEERFLNYNVNNWDTMNDGVWNRVSPMEAKSLKELTEGSFNQRTPHELTKEEVLSFPGQKYDPRMKYTGFTYNDLLTIANTAAPGLAGTQWADYFRDIAKQKVIARGDDPTSDNINKQLARDIANSQIEYMVNPVGDMKDWYNQQQLAIGREKLNIANRKLKLLEGKQDNNKLYPWTARMQRGVADVVNASAQNILNRQAGLNKALAPKIANAKNKKAVLRFLGLGDNEIASIASIYKSAQYRPTGIDAIPALDLLSGIDYTKDKTNTLNNNVRRAMSFRDDQIRLTRQAEYSFSGYTTSKGSLTNRFADYLKRNNIKGEVDSNEVSVNFDVDSTGKPIYLINGYSRVKESDLNGFFKDDGQSKRIGKMNRLGLMRSAEIGKVLNDDAEKASSNNIKWNNIGYVDIPFTRVIPADGMTESSINTYADEHITPSTAAKRLQVYQIEDLLDLDKL